MNDSLLEKIWRTSPDSLLRSVRRRFGVESARAPVRPTWVRVNAGPLAGRELLLATELGGAWAEMRDGTYDRELFDRLVVAVPLAGATVWDIGAHFGYHTLSFAALAGAAGRVVAFEPNPFNRERLALNLERNSDLASRVVVLPKAVSNADGEAEFVFSADIDSGDSSCSHLGAALPPRPAEAYAEFRRERVPTVRIDTLLTQRAGEIPRVLKIDVEGAEWLVLEGGREFFFASPPGDDDGGARHPADAAHRQIFARSRLPDSRR
jgi:FkbM family methyltransferase